MRYISRLTLHSRSAWTIGTISFLLCLLPTLTAAPLSEPRLLGKTLWSAQPGSRLDVFPGGKFKISSSADSPSHIGEGKWTITGDTLLLAVEKSYVQDAPAEPYAGISRATCRIESSDSLDYFEFLVCKGEGNAPWVSLTFILPDSAVAPGSTRSIDGERVVMLGKKRGIPTTSLMFRRKPIEDGEVIDARTIGGMQNPELWGLPSAAVPPGERTQITVYARTEQKAKVGKREDYWLYVQIGSTTGWVFGEFVKIAEPEK